MSTMSDIHDLFVARIIFDSPSSGRRAVLCSSQAPQTQQPPYTIMRNINDNNWHHLGGAAGNAMMDLELTHWADTMEEAELLALAYHNHINGFNGRHGETRLVIHIKDQRDAVENEIGGEVDVFGQQQDLLIEHSVPAPTSV